MQSDYVRALAVRLDLVTLSSKTLEDVQRERVSNKISSLKRRIHCLESAASVLAADRTCSIGPLAVG